MQAEFGADPCPAFDDSINYMKFCQGRCRLCITSTWSWVTVTNYFTQFKIDQQRSQGFPHQELLDEAKERFIP